MHNDIHLPRNEQFLQLARPQTLGTEVVQGRLLVLVADRAEGGDFEGAARCELLETIPDALGLDDGEIGFPRTDSQRRQRRRG